MAAQMMGSKGTKSKPRTGKTGGGGYVVSNCGSNAVKGECAKTENSNTAELKEIRDMAKMGVM